MAICFHLARHASVPPANRLAVEGESYASEGVMHVQGRLENHGRVTLSAPARLTVDGGFVNHASVGGSGTLHASKFANGKAASVVLGRGERLTIVGSLKNSGNIRVQGGALSVDGLFVNAGAGFVDVALGAGHPIAVSGDVYLGGALNVSLPQDRKLRSGQKYVAMTWQGRRKGEFEDVSCSTCPRRSPISLFVEYDDSRGVAYIVVRERKAERQG